MRPGPILLLASCLAAPLVAQDSSAGQWRRSLIAAPEFGGQYGVGLALGAKLGLPSRPVAPWVTADLSGYARWGVTGSRQATLQFDAPGLDRDWRFLALLRTERLLRTPYFGVDNQTPTADSALDRYGIIYYRSALLRSTALAVVQRRLAGPLWLHLAGQARHYRTSPLRQTPTLYQRDLAAAAAPDTARGVGYEGRIGLLYDSRDDWATPARGALLEAIVAFGRLGRTLPPAAGPYRRYLFGAREFITLGDSGRTVLALRQRVSFTSRSLPFFLAYEQFTSWLPDDGVVGSHGIRLHGGGNQLASQLAFGSVDLRRKLLMLREDRMRPVRLWGQLFADVGKLWEFDGDAFNRRTQWTVGAGLRAQLSRGTLTGFDVGVTDIGVNLVYTGSFAF